jgi:hypothetical protein
MADWMSDKGVSFNDIQNMEKIKNDLKEAREVLNNTKDEETIKPNDNKDEIANKNIELIEANGKIELLEQQLKDSKDQQEKQKNDLKHLEDLEDSKKIVDDKLRKTEKEFKE